MNFFILHHSCCGAITWLIFLKFSITGKYSIELYPIHTLNNGLCYRIISGIKLRESFLSYFSFKVIFNVPEEERPKTLLVAMGEKEDFDLLSYKPWPGSKPFISAIPVGQHSNAALLKNIWNLHSNDERPCEDYKENHTFIKCLAGNLYERLKQPNDCKELCSFPGSNEYLNLVNNDIGKNYKGQRSKL